MIKALIKFTAAAVVLAAALILTCCLAFKTSGTDAGITDARKTEADITQSYVKPEHIVMFGDSITYLADWSALLPGHEVVNLGVSGDKVCDLILRVDSVRREEPSKLFIMVGINDLLSGYSIKETLASYDELLTLCTGYEVYIQSVLPVSDMFGMPAEVITGFNAELKKLASMHGAEYIDLYPVYADANGYIKTEYTGDGLHLLREAYKPWVEILRDHL